MGMSDSDDLKPESLLYYGPSGSAIWEACKVCIRNKLLGIAFNDTVVFRDTMSKESEKDQVEGMDRSLKRPKG